MLLGSDYYSFSLDYWSLGIIAYELIYRKHRFRGNSEIDMLFKIFEQKGTPEFNEMLLIQDYTYVDAEFQVKFPKFK